MLFSNLGYYALISGLFFSIILIPIAYRDLNLINHSEKPNTKQLLNFSANLNKNAKLAIHPIDINGKLIKNNYFIHLNKQGSECLFNGFSLTDKKEHIDNYIEIYHNNKFTISRLNYKSITKG